MTTPQDKTRHAPQFGLNCLLEAYKDQNIHEALTKIRRYHCAYHAPHCDQVCDCKFGADHLAKHSESGNGCPEIRYAQEMCLHLVNMVEQHTALVEALKLILEANDDIRKDFDSAIKQGRAALKAVEGE